MAAAATTWKPEAVASVVSESTKVKANLPQERCNQVFHKMFWSCLLLKSFPCTCRNRRFWCDHLDPKGRCPTWDRDKWCHECEERRDQLQFPPRKTCEKRILESEFMFQKRKLTQRRVLWIFQSSEFGTWDHHHWQTPWQSRVDPWFGNKNAFAPKKEV